MSELIEVAESPLLARWRLAAELAEMRDDRGWSQARVARAVGCSAGQIGMVESRDRLPSEDLLGRLLKLYGHSEQLSAFTALRAVAQRPEPRWRGIDNTNYVLGFERFVELEHAAAQIDLYETRLVPGLFQTRDYALATLLGGRSRAGIERKLEIRLSRQEILSRSTPVQVWAIIDESALDRPVGSVEVMRAQYDRLLTLIDQVDNIRIQVAPVSLGARVGLLNPFIMLQFPRYPAVVTAETRVRTLFFHEPAEVTQFTYELQHLREIALSQDDTADLIKNKREEL